MRRRLLELDAHEECSSEKSEQKLKYYIILMYWIQIYFGECYLFAYDLLPMVVKYAVNYKQRSQYQIWCLGQGGSGKTTFIKHCKMLVNGEISEWQISECKDGIQRALSQYIQSILKLKETIEDNNENKGMTNPLGAYPSLPLSKQDIDDIITYWNEV